MARPTEGRDRIEGGSGADTLRGDGAGDTLAGGAGDDVLYGHSRADRDPDSGAIVVDLVADGFEQPVWAAAAPGRPDELFVLEKSAGRIAILDLATGATRPAPFLDIPDGEISGSGEQGLLGLAFHPDYATNGRFFVFVTNSEGDNEVREYRRSAANPDRAHATFVRDVITIEHPDNSNHNGGWLGFGPDGNLYISTGDGGSQGDPDNSAQNIDELSGKILRLDVDGDDFAGDASRNYAIPDDNPFAAGPGADEVWHYGLRNPWRPSFDRATGDFWIADVGWGSREEVDFVRAGTPGGLNFGWHVKEGDVPAIVDTPGNPDPDDPSLVDPIAVYGHGADGGSITGGYVFRGAGGLQGHYIFADFRTDALRTLVLDDRGRLVDIALRNDQLELRGGAVWDAIASFAEDASGKLYALSITGQLLAIRPSTAASDGDDRLLAGAGDDRAFGGAGDDVLLGHSGADWLAGGRGADDLRGGSGDDTLSGGDGADILTAGGGDNLVRGGAGADRFVLTLGALDDIADFEDGIDVIDLRALDDVVFIGADAFSGTAGEVRAVAREGRSFLAVDLDGDAAADIAVRIRGNAVIDAADLLL